MHLYNWWMRNILKFTFNEALNEAQLVEHVCLLGTALCTPCHFMHIGVNMMVVKESDGSWTRNEYPAAPLAEYVANGFRNEPAWTSAKKVRQQPCGTVYRPGEKVAYGCGYKWEPLLTKAGVNKQNLKLAKITGSNLKRNEHAHFLGSNLFF
jgi:hypothetical protein